MTLKKQILIGIGIGVIIGGVIMGIIILVRVLNKKSGGDTPPSPPPNNYIKCDKNPTTCTTDSDCHKCEEYHQKVEMSCVQFNGPKGPKYCSSTNAKKNCNVKFGGVNVWSDWDNPDRMEWDCLCGDGSYAAGADPNGTTCDINPDICANGTFTWTVDTGKAPDSSFCICPEDTVKYVSKEGGYPICVPNDPLTELMYSDTYEKE